MLASKWHWSLLLRLWTARSLRLRYVDGSYWTHPLDKRLPDDFWSLLRPRESRSSGLECSSLQARPSTTADGCSASGVAGRGHCLRSPGLSFALDSPTQRARQSHLSGNYWRRGSLVLEGRAGSPGRSTHGARSFAVYFLVTGIVGPQTTIDSAPEDERSTNSCRPKCRTIPKKCITLCRRRKVVPSSRSDWHFKSTRAQPNVGIYYGSLCTT